MRSIGFVLALLATWSVALSQDSIWQGRTTGKLPYLEYGIGMDRLGGAKMCYLDSAILLRIVDSFSTDYKVRLSKNHSAYIPKEDIVLIGKEANLPVIHNSYLSGP